MAPVADPPAGDEDDVLTAAEVASWLKLSVFTVRAAARAGRLPALRVGRTWRFSRKAIEARLVEPEYDARFRHSSD